MHWTVILLAEAEGHLLMLRSQVAASDAIEAARMAHGALDGPVDVIDVMVFEGWLEDHADAALIKLMLR